MNAATADAGGSGADVAPPPEEDLDRSDRWKASSTAPFELAALIAAIAGVVGLGMWVGAPLDDIDGCPSLVRLEVAVPAADVPGGRDPGLRTFDDLITCPEPAQEPRDDVLDAVETSTRRDTMWFIPAYTLLLWWAGSRLAGRRRPPGWDRLLRSGPVRWIAGRLTALTQGTSGRSGDPDPRHPFSPNRFDARLADLRAKDEEGRRTARARLASDLAVVESESVGLPTRIRRRAGLRLRQLRDWGGRKWSSRRERKKVRADLKAALRRQPEPGADDAAAAPKRAGLVVRTVAGWSWPRRFVHAVARRAEVFLEPLAAVDRSPSSRRVARVAMWFASAAALLDGVENWAMLERVSTRRGLEPGEQPGARADHILRLMSSAATAKFVLLALPVVLVVVVVLRLGQASSGSRVLRIDRRRVAVAGPIAPSAVAEEVSPKEMSDLAPTSRWWIGQRAPGGIELGIGNPENEDCYGVCFSGGGIRSATFGLGALQTLEEPPPVGAEHWGIGAADYISAVSGGSYISATYQQLGHETGPVHAQPADPLFPKAGAVEHHLRRSATHLADGASEWFLGLGEILVRTLFTVSLVVLGVFAVGLPLGWMYRYLYYGAVDGVPEMALSPRLMIGPLLAVGILVAFRTRARVRDGRGSFENRDVATAAARSAGVLFLALVLIIPFVAINVTDLLSKLGSAVGVSSEEVDDDEIARQLDAVLEGAARTAEAAAQAQAAADVSGNVRASTLDVGLAARRTAVTVADIEAAAARRSDEGSPPRPTAEELRAADAQDGREVDVIATYAAAFGTCPTASFAPAPEATDAERRALRLARLSCIATENARATANVVGSVGVALSDDEESDPEARADYATAASDAVAAAGDAAAANAAIAAEVDSNDNTWRASRLFAGLTLLLSIANALLARREASTGGVAKPPSAKGGLKALPGKLGLGTLTSMLVGIGTSVVLVVFLSDVIVAGWSTPVGEPLKILVTRDVWMWWVQVVGLLALATAFANFNTWSLRPFYHRRLWIPYAVNRSGRTKDWTDDTRLSEVGAKVVGRPELLVCAAAQVSGRRWAPPGRRALSYVLSGEVCGGPEVGFVETSLLESILERRPRLRQPITLFGASTLSGAAVGPAMGRHSKGGLGAALAIANVRLGAWLPHPRHLHTLASEPDDQRGLRLRRAAIARWPRIWYWLMEIVGQYPMDARMVMVTDGGHLENLGLLELVRRRCSRIACFDASGAGLTPTTLAEAMVLVREELGVDILLDPLPADLPATNAAGDLDVIRVEASGADPLLRSSGVSDLLVAALAHHPVLTATIHYPRVVAPDGSTIEGFTGTLVYGTLALSGVGAEDWDLLEYAQRRSDFPRHGTDKQWFEADVFGAYHQLGRRTAARMLETASTLDA